MTDINAAICMRNKLPINPPNSATGRFAIGRISAAVVDSLLERDALTL